MLKFKLTIFYLSWLTYFSRSRGQNVKIKFSVNQGGTDHNRFTHTERLVILHAQAVRARQRPTNERSSKTEN